LPDGVRNPAELIRSSQSRPDVVLDPAGIIQVEETAVDVYKVLQEELHPAVDRPTGVVGDLGHKAHDPHFGVPPDPDAAHGMGFLRGRQPGREAVNGK
jgi:hypothetical protein